MQWEYSDIQNVLKGTEEEVLDQLKAKVIIASCNEEEAIVHHISKKEIRERIEEGKFI